MALRWTADAVRQAAAEWVWVPQTADQILTSEYQLIAYPPHFQHPTQVAWSKSERPVAEIIDEVTAQVRRWGRDTVYWWVRADTGPRGTEAGLRSRGATVAETVTVLAYDLADSLPDLGLPGGLASPLFASLPLAARPDGDAGSTDVAWLASARAELVRNEHTLRASNLVNAEVWDDHRERTAAGFAAELADVRAALEIWDDFRMVVYADGQPAAAGGCGLVDGVGRLWGAGTRPAFRRRGMYRVLLAARMAVAREHGATLALVKGRIDTSGPILQRCGFTAYGEERSYCLPV